jgi:uncharacterized alkaline shock family protein YloU
MTLTTPAAAPGAGVAAGDPGERGATTIADRVIERIAAQVVSEVDAAGGSARRVLGVAVGSAGLSQSAQVTAIISGKSASLTVQLSVAYPASISGTARQARQQLADRLQDLTGYTVSRVDVTVTAVHASVKPTRRVL